MRGHHLYHVEQSDSLLMQRRLYEFLSDRKTERRVKP